MKPYVASHLKDMNRQMVYKYIRERESTSKAELSKLTGISPPTVLKIINFFKEQGLIVEVGEGEASIGRKPQMLMINRELMYFAAFFMEGDFLSMGIVDILGSVIYKKTIKVKTDFDYIMNMISETLIPEMLDESGIPEDKLLGIGIALPVIYDPAACTISGAPLVEDTEERNICREIRALEEKYNAVVIVENDANSQALGEFERSGCHEKDDLILISVGTGMGAGVILGGKLVEILGQDLTDKVNDYLNHHCITGVQVRMESTEDIGLIGIASLVTGKKIHEILTMAGE